MAWLLGGWQGAVGWGHLTVLLILLCLFGAIVLGRVLSLQDSWGRLPLLSLALCFSFPSLFLRPRKGQGIPTICSLPGTWEHSFLVSLGSLPVHSTPLLCARPLRECRSLTSSSFLRTSLLPTASVTPTAHVPPVSHPLICAK